MHSARLMFSSVIEGHEMFGYRGISYQNQLFVVLTKERSVIEVLLYNEGITTTYSIHTNVVCIIVIIRTTI